MNFKDVSMPFSHARQLFRMLVEWHHRAESSGGRGLPAKPNYTTFRKLLKDPRFGLTVVKFHRKIEMGRCAQCALLAFRCRTAQTPVAREAWQRIAARHQWLQRAQKVTYAVDRAKAAADYPRRTLYFAMDGGGGRDFILPHMAGADEEGPSKAVAGLATNPMKVMNGLVHGDSRSHVILSPGTIVASANHTCESVAVILSVAFEDHGDIPPEIVLQMDNASPNHNILVFAFCGLYVLEDVCERFRIRFELPHHAHDIYDAFEAVHAKAVHNSTFFSLSELVSIIEAAHKGIPGGSTSEAKAGSLMGHNVLVSLLWEVRDYYEWLAPGYRDPAQKKEAMSRAAFVCYDKLSGFHDFLIRKDKNGSVGLWGKQYMSDPDSAMQFIGTLTDRQLVRDVVGSRVPPAAPESDASQKCDVDKGFLSKLKGLTTGKFKDQFSAARMSDAVAICSRNWDHFKDLPHSLPPHRRLLPSELAMKLRQARKRAADGPHVWPSRPQYLHGDPRERSELSEACREKVVLPRQLTHLRCPGHRLLRGDAIALIARYGQQPKTVAELLARPAGLGAFVSTRAFKSKPLTEAWPSLGDARHWIWRILRIYEPGDEFDQPVGGKSVAETRCYQAHLYRPVNNGVQFNACWNVIRGGWNSRFRTDAEKAERRKEKARKAEEKASRKAEKASRKAEKASRKGTEAAENIEAMQKKRRRQDDSDDDAVKRSPVFCILRPENFVSGGFHLTKRRRVPAFIQKYLDALPAFKR